MSIEVRQLHFTEIKSPEDVDICYSLIAHGIIVIVSLAPSEIPKLRSTQNEIDYMKAGYAQTYLAEICREKKLYRDPDDLPLGYYLTTNDLVQLVIGDGNHRLALAHHLNISIGVKIVTARDYPIYPITTILKKIKPVIIELEN